MLRDKTSTAGDKNLLPVRLSKSVISSHKYHRNSTKADCECLIVRITCAIVRI